MTLSSMNEYMEFAVETAHKAGRLTLGYFQTDLQPEMKDDDTPVTVADRKAEELIRARIERRARHCEDLAALLETVITTAVWLDVAGLAAMALRIRPTCPSTKLTQLL